MGSLSEVLIFSKEFLFNPVSISSVFPSSKHLSRLIVSMCNLKSATTVFELGCGTGAITGEIVKVANNSKIFSFDINSKFVEIVKEKYPQVEAINDAAENVKKYMKIYSIKEVDIVVSSLPWAAFSKEKQERLVSVIYDILGEKGEFITYAYLHTRPMRSHKRFMEVVRGKFKTILLSKVVCFNLPPAFVIKCEKR